MTDEERELAELEAAARRVRHHCGVPAVTFGPGSISQAHAPDEHVSLAQVRDAASSMLTAALTLLGGWS